MSYFLTQACINLRPEAGVSIDESGIHWHNISENDIPSNEEIEVESNRLQNIYNSKEYQRQRAAEYPSFADQFDLLYHGGYDAWKNVIQTVKTKYPKPE
jgi:rhodanese-related sulfurtransferase